MAQQYFCLYCTDVRQTAEQIIWGANKNRGISQIAAYIQWTEYTYYMQVNFSTQIRVSDKTYTIFLVSFLKEVMIFCDTAQYLCNIDTDDITFEAGNYLPG